MSLEKIINDAWENKDQISPNADQELKDAINQTSSDFILPAKAKQIDDVM